MRGDWRAAGAGGVLGLAVLALGWTLAPAVEGPGASRGEAAEASDREGAEVSRQEAPADLVLVNGRIVTVDPERPEARTLAAADGRILAVGTDEEIGALVGPDTRVLDLEGRLAVPGLIEGHGHFMGLGRSLMILDLTEAETWGEIVDMVAEAARETEPGEWIEGRGWHQEKWSEVPEGAVEGVPTHHSLSVISPDNPVILGHASGHAAFANAAAMEAADITADTPDPEGGEIVRDASGEPTGLLRETAQGLVGRARSRTESERPPAEREAEARERVRLASREALSKGITTFHDAGSSFETVDLFRRMAAEGELPLRLYVMIREGADELDARLDEYRMEAFGDGHLTVRAIKRTIDGALGSHGAWLLEPYADLPRTSGLNTTPVDEIERTARVAAEHGFQLNVHAIGDRANRVVLDIFEETFRAHPDREKEQWRWRIEHAQHLHPDDIPRFAELGVIASMQAIHACSDGPWVVQRLGEVRAANGAYVWQDLLNSGAVVTNGTDTPVEDVDPIASYHCAVTRELDDGSTFFPNQTMTREEALESYTIANAYAAFEEDVKGSLEPGKLADVTVLSKDILSVPSDEILDAEVVYTIVGGEVLYARDGSRAGEVGGS